MSPQEARARELLAQHYLAKTKGKGPIDRVDIICAAAGWPQPAEQLITDGLIKPERHDELDKWLHRVANARTALERFGRSYHAWMVVRESDHSVNASKQVHAIMIEEATRATICVFAWLGGHDAENLLGTPKLAPGNKPD